MTTRVFRVAGQFGRGCQDEGCAPPPVGTGGSNPGGGTGTGGGSDGGGGSAVKKGGWPDKPGGLDTDTYADMLGHEAVKRLKEVAPDKDLDYRLAWASSGKGGGGGADTIVMDIHGTAPGHKPRYRLDGTYSGNDPAVTISVRVKPDGTVQVNDLIVAEGFSKDAIEAQARDLMDDLGKHVATQKRTFRLATVSV